MIHISRNPYYRSPFGAVKAGTIIKLRLALESGETGKVVLRLWVNDSEIRLPMNEESGNVFSAEIDTSGSPRLIWYWFELLAEDGSPRLWCNSNLGSIENYGKTAPYPGDSFQITVYSESFSPPEWLREGCLYQIMVDRFYRHEKNYLAQRNDIAVHKNWHEPPDYSPEGRTNDNAALDFFGGNLPGIVEKLPYLQQLGISVIYLNPIFKARSNHKYDTGDYHEVDPTYGDENDLRLLCERAAKLGIKILLDGVFSHTGEDSKYFNALGTYEGTGAAQSQSSPYYNWYSFKSWPRDYAAWWGVPTLPEVNEDHPDYLNYIIKDHDSVIAHWLKAGIYGWRLDVADELPDVFLDELYKKAKQQNPCSAVLGEVWEDASNKVSYGKMRRYLLGGQMDTVMNYPLRKAFISLLTGEGSANKCACEIMQLFENYPKAVFYSLMNMMGTHDRVRIINRLSGQQAPPKNSQAGALLSLKQRSDALEKVRAMWLAICAMPGMPSIYYGDEAGLEGWNDPYNRSTYPWGREDAGHLSYIKSAIRLRKENQVLISGHFEISAVSERVLQINRWLDNKKDAFGKSQSGPERAVIFLNANDFSVEIACPADKNPNFLSSSDGFKDKNGYTIPKHTCAVWFM